MMTLFWLLLAALLLLALLFVWWPWLKKKPQQPLLSEAAERNRQNVEIFKQRVGELEQELARGNLDQGSFDDLKQELELSLLQEVDESSDSSTTAAQQSSRNLTLPIGLSILVPCLSVFLYLQLGASDKLMLPPSQPSTAQSEEGHQRADFEQQVEQLQARLEAEPENPQGWFMLGRSYLTLERYQDAYNAFSKVAELVGEHAEIISQKAQALYFLNNNQLTAEVQALVDQALELDPTDPGTLGLVGMAAYEAGQYPEAIAVWQTLFNSDNPDVNRDGLQEAIDQAKGQLAQQGIEYNPEALERAANTAADADSTAGAVETSTASLKVLVEVDSKLKQGLAPETTVFVFAQAVAGPKMPLAAAKLQLRDLPTMVTLDDSMAMGPMAKLSSAEQVQIRAIVSRSGRPGTEAGDIQGGVSPVDVAGNEALIKIMIDEVVQ